MKNNDYECDSIINGYLVLIDDLRVYRKGWSKLYRFISSEKKKFDLFDPTYKLLDKILDEMFYLETGKRFGSIKGEE